MNVYGLIMRARQAAAKEHLSKATRHLVIDLTEQLESAVTKLRDKEWDREWAVKRRRAKELQDGRERARKHRAKLKKRQ